MLTVQRPGGLEGGEQEERQRKVPDKQLMDEVRAIALQDEVFGAKGGHSSYQPNGVPSKPKPPGYVYACSSEHAIWYAART